MLLLVLNPGATTHQSKLQSPLLAELQSPLLAEAPLLRAGFGIADVPLLCVGFRIAEVTLLRAGFGIVGFARLTARPVS